MKKIALLIGATIVILTFAASIFAQPVPEVMPNVLGGYPKAASPQDKSPTIFKSEYWKGPAKAEEPYRDTFAEKFGNGAINTAGSWTEIPREMAKVTEQEDLVAGCTFGLVQGIVSGTQRGVAGIYDAATFILPPYDDPIMEPAYQTKKPEKEGLRITIFSW